MILRRCVNPPRWSRLIAPSRFGRPSSGTARPIATACSPKGSAKAGAIARTDRTATGRPMTGPSPAASPDR